MVILLDHGAEVDKADREGATALYAAAWNKSQECVSLLLSYGASTDRADNKRRTALWFAAKKGYQVVAELLVESGAGIEIADRDGKTAIDIAKERRHTKLADYLTTMSKRHRRGAFAKVCSNFMFIVICLIRLSESEQLRGRVRH
jgi:ankyrin repeat protein